jgi:smad nuclear-interacting protein 1
MPYYRDRSPRVKQEDRSPVKEEECFRLKRNSGRGESSRRRSRSPKRESRESKPAVDSTPAKEPEKPTYEQSGLLSAETNKASNGVVLKYHEPTDAAMPPNNSQYRIYIFEDNGDIIDTIKLNQRSSYLFGRDKTVCDVPLNIKSSSSQHAVVQFRMIYKTDKYGDTHESVKPYLIDLESSYGTKLNHESIPSSRYIELRHKDLIQFGGAKQEFVWIQDEQ